MSSATEFVRLSDVTKDFSGVKALENVHLCAYAGETLALVGENGAGKSTLMNILSGTYPSGSFSGKIEIEGRAVEFHSPSDAERAGITIIHQELSAFPDLTVAENMLVGKWPTKNGLVDWGAIELQAGEWLAKVGASFSPLTRMGDLSTGGQQLVEIAKALARNSRLLILDEPTSSLTPKEVEKLFVLLNKLRAEGKALIYISHKMEEIFALADRVTVLRDGKSVHTALAKDIDEPKLISQMVGRSLDRLFPPPPERAKEFLTAPPVLSVRDLQLLPLERGKRAVGPVSFELRKGEILGFAGLLGAGRTEVVQALLGGTRGQFKLSGAVELSGSQGAPANPRAALRSGLALVGEDRKRDSIFAIRSLDENVSLSRLVSRFIGRVLDPANERDQSRETFRRLKTRYRDEQQKIQELSGGNQQKIVIGRVLQMAPEVIILDEPTRGVDVGAKFEIYQILFELASAGKALIVVSSDLPELMALSDRIMVLSGGRVAGELSRDRFSQDEIMRLAVSTSAASASGPSAVIADAKSPASGAFI